MEDEPSTIPKARGEDPRMAGAVDFTCPIHPEISGRHVGAPVCSPNAAAVGSVHAEK